MPVVRTLARPFRYEIPKIKGSRFLACVEPVPDEPALMAWVDTLRHEFPDATHHCWAGVLGTGTEPEPLTRSSDDGEPSGTAGRPILREIRGRGLVQVGVVVVRWYGGTKLGTGGLVRAYGGAAAEALERADIVERRLTRDLRLRYAYDLTGPVDGVLSAHSLEPGDAQYGSDVARRIAVPVEDVDEVADDLREATAGQIVIVLGESVD